MKAEGVKGHLDLVLLGIVAIAPGHGYAVINELKQRTGGVLDLTEGSVYPALHRLEDLGLVASVWKLAGGRRRREYELTSDGMRALAAERREWRRLVGGIDAILSARPGRRFARPVGDPA